MRIVLPLLWLLLCPAAMAQSNDRALRDALSGARSAYAAGDENRARSELARAAALAPSQTDPGARADYECDLGTIQYDEQDRALGERTLVSALAELRASGATDFKATAAEVCLMTQLVLVFNGRGARAEARVMAGRAAALFIEGRPERLRRLAQVNRDLRRLDIAGSIPDTDLFKVPLLRSMVSELQPEGATELIAALDRIEPPLNLESARAFVTTAMQFDEEAAARADESSPGRAAAARRDWARQRLLLAPHLELAGDPVRAIEWYNTGIAVLRGVRGEERLVFRAEAERVALLELLGRPGYERHAAGATLVLDASANLRTYDESELAREGHYIRLAIEAGLEAVYTRTR